MPAPRPPFSSKIIKIHKISYSFGKPLNHVVILMNSEIFLFLMKKALSKRFIFLRKYWCFCSAGRQKAGESQFPCQNQKKWKHATFSVFLIKCSGMELLRVFEGLGPDMGSRTYEKGQELLLFLHAGGKAPVLGEISKNV